MQAMKKNISLDNWQIDPDYTDEKRTAEIAIHLKFPDYKSVIDLSPAERKKQITLDLKEKYDRLLATKMFDNHTIIGTSRRPTGITTVIPFTALATLEGMDFIGHVFIKNIDHAKKIEAEMPKLYCVKMTVAIEVEGQTKGYQDYEEKLVLIKAASADDAYDKLNETKNDYSEPYLNYAGELLRWRIESLDDCYEFYLSDLENLDSPEGVEVYSALKRRKLSPDRIWDGKLE